MSQLEPNRLVTTTDYYCYTQKHLPGRHFLIDLSMG